MATLTPIKITESALDSSLSDCTSGGDEFINSGVEFIRIENTHASATYTIKISVTNTNVKHPQFGELTKSNVYKTVAGGGTASIYIGPFKQGGFNDKNQKVQISYKTGSGTTDSAFNALSAIAGTHKLKIEVLYLDN